MKTIVEPKQTVAQLWGKQHVREDQNYRLMKYVLRVDHEGKVLLHNVVTGHLVLLSEEEAELIPKLPMSLIEPMKELITNHFFVPDNYDEYKTVNQLRSIYQHRSTGDAINQYVILPTTFCNAHCFYCYENDYPRIHMTEETASKLVKYIAEHRNNKEVRLSWFGGEPLVGIERIDQISKGLKDLEIPFSASMISNGYLFDEEIVKRSVELWNLQKIQITLDGTEEVYNRVKAYLNVKDNPYQRVLKNIDLLSDNKVYVNIRLNVDYYNQDNIRLLIDELGERYPGNEYVTVYLNMLFNDQGYDPVHHSQENILELLNVIDDYTKVLKEKKLGYDRIGIPVLKVTQCMADNPHAVEIQPDGSFCRCEHETNRDSYGNLDEGVLDPQKILKWRETVERSDYCPECSLYPSCYLLRYCMSGSTPCVESNRKKALGLNKELLCAVYQNSLKEEKNERICNS